MRNELLPLRRSSRIIHERRRTACASTLPVAPVSAMARRKRGSGAAADGNRQRQPRRLPPECSSRETRAGGENGAAGRSPGQRRRRRSDCLPRFDHTGGRSWNSTSPRRAARAPGCHVPRPGSDPLPSPGAAVPMQMQAQCVAFEHRPARHHLTGEPPLLHLQHHRRTSADRMRRRGTHAAARHELDRARHGGVSGPKHLQSGLDATRSAKTQPLVHRFLTSPRR